MKTLIMILFSMVFLSSCKGTDYTNFLDLFEKRQALSLQLFDGMIADSLMSPDTFISAGDYLILSEPKLPDLLAAYHFKKHSLRRFLPKGQGEGEAANIQTLGCWNGGNTFYAHDVLSQSVFLVTLNDSSETVRMDILPHSKTVCSLAYDGDVAFYMTTGDSMRFMMRRSGRYSSFGKLPPVDAVSPQTLSQSLQGPMLISVGKKRLAWFSVFGDVMEIYDYSHPDEVCLVKSLPIALPVYSQSSSRDSGALDPRTKMGVSSVTSDGNHIYALYNEHVLADAVTKQDDLFYCTKILVFDWEGNPLKVLQADKRIRSVTYREEEGKLYCLGLSDELDPVIYVADAGLSD